MEPLWDFCGTLWFRGTQFGNLCSNLSPPLYTFATMDLLYSSMSPTHDVEILRKDRNLRHNFRLFHFPPNSSHFW